MQVLFRFMCNNIRYFITLSSLFTVGVLQTTVKERGHD